MRKVYHKIIQIVGNVICVEAENVSYNELAEVNSPRGTSLAQVIRLDGLRVYLQVFAGSRGVATDTPSPIGAGNAPTTLQTLLPAGKP